MLGPPETETAGKAGNFTGGDTGNHSGGSSNDNSINQGSPQHHPAKDDKRPKPIEVLRSLNPANRPEMMIAARAWLKPVCDGLYSIDEARYFIEQAAKQAPSKAQIRSYYFGPESRT